MFWLKKHYLCLVIIKNMNMRKYFLLMMCALFLPMMACAQAEKAPDFVTQKTCIL